MSGPQLPPPPSSNTPTPPVVLCIDDQEDGLAIRRLFLETMGYEVLTAASGRAGLALMGKHRVDAVVLDYRMPEMDGETVATELRRLHPGLPIIMLSGYVADIPPQVHQLVNSFVSKGTSPLELINSLQTALGMPPKKPAARPASTIVEQAKEKLELSESLVERNRDRLRQQGKKD